MVANIDTNLESKVDTSTHHNKSGDTNVASGNTDDHSTGHNVSVSSDRHYTLDSHYQSAGGDITDRHAAHDRHDSQMNVGGTVYNVGAGEEVTHHPDGSTTVAPAHRPGGGGGGGGVHHDYPKLHSHGPTVEHWKRQLNSVMQAGLAEDSNFDQDTHDWTVYFQQQNGLTADGVVGPATQGAMDAQYRPQPHQQQGPFHPDTHGQFDPNQHGQYHPDQHGQFDPQMHGDFNPYVHGQFDPQLHGEFNPYVHGQFNPEYHGQYNPQQHGQYNPQYHGEFDPQIHGQYHQETHGQYHPEMHGQYHPDRHGAYDPNAHGQFDENIHGKHDPQLHGEHDPQIHGELSIY
jgi:peptidoglycan hydrolase-like protein with peptidoglycan-binding domain